MRFPVSWASLTRRWVAKKCRGLVAPHRVRTRVALDAQMLAVVEAVLVLGMKGGAAFYHVEDPPQAFVVFHQQRAGGGADEHLDAGATRRAFQLRQVSHIVAGTADEEGKIAMHAMPAAFDLVGKRLLGNGQGIGVRHFEHRRHPAHDCAARAGFEVFLVGLAGLAKMNLGIDHAGQDVQAFAVDHLGGRGLCQRADFGDTAAPEADVAHALAVLIDHGAGF